MVDSFVLLLRASCLFLSSASSREAMALYIVPKIDSLSRISTRDDTEEDFVYIANLIFQLQSNLTVRRSRFVHRSVISHAPSLFLLG